MTPDWFILNHDQFQLKQSLLPGLSTRYGQIAFAIEQFITTNDLATYRQKPNKGQAVVNQKEKPTKLGYTHFKTATSHKYGIENPVNTTPKDHQIHWCIFPSATTSGTPPALVAWRRL